MKEWLDAQVRNAVSASLEAYRIGFLGALFVAEAFGDIVPEFGDTQWVGRGSSDELGFVPPVPVD